ncbi:hypothetical protein E8E14_010988 [Neopestalotiopsis sp. 37M]|nr:hypothetical protein E8E14_010988 [Neopestalotiopsis sp. 37M]
MDLADTRDDVAPSVPIRRNGKPHSCEPCRLSKIRCDHKLPVCDRCVLRRMEKRCIYHPAPMTKPRSSRPPASVSAQTRQSSVTSLIVEQPAARALPPVPDTAQPAFIGSTSLPSTPRTAHSADAGFFGPTAFSAVINDDQEVITQHVKHLYEQQLPHNTHQSQGSITEERIQAGMKTLELLVEFPTFPECIYKYLEITYTCMVPDPFVKTCVTSLQQTMHDSMAPPSQSGAGDLRQLVVTLCANTAKPLELFTHIAAKDYHSLFTGPNLRWETVGCVLALLGVSFKYDINRWSEPLGTLAQQPTFIHRIAEAVDYCTSVCFSHNAVNHQALWLLYGQACLKNVVYGDMSFQLWRCIGDLSSMFSALGLHQAAIGSEEAYPYYQRDLRRRYAAQIYSMDKTTSTLLGRPPRISAHYAITMPADIDDNVLLLDDIELHNTLKNADSNGWNVDRRFRGATWRRIKLIISQFREEVLEICLGTRHTGNFGNLIDDILGRHQNIWDKVPPELKYNEVTGSQHIEPPQRYVLMTTYMDQNYNHFLLFRKLAKETRTMPASLYQISRSLLATTLQVISLSDQVYSMQRDMSWFILYYGLPAASILAVGLLKDSLRDSNNPNAPKASIPRAETVQNLSVFVSTLQRSINRREVNQESCKWAHRILSSILEEIIDPTHRRVAEGTEQTHSLASMLTVSPQALDGGSIDFYDFMNRIEDAGWARDIWDFPMEI